MYTDKLEIKYLFWTWRQKYSEGRGQGDLRPGNEEKMRKEMAQIINSDFFLGRETRFQHSLSCVPAWHDDLHSFL